MSKFAMALSLIATLITLSFSATAQEDAAEKEISLLNKFILISGAKEQFQQVQVIVQNQVKQSIIEAIRRNPKVQNIPEAKRQELLNIISSSVTSFNQKFSKELSAAIPFDQAVEKVYLPVYTNKFTEEELKDIIAFYESSAGQKFVQITPNLMQESAMKMNQEYGQTINNISQKIAKDEFAGISYQIEQLSNSSQTQQPDTVTQPQTPVVK